MITDDKAQVKSRFVFNEKAENDPVKIMINIRQSDNVLARVLDTKIPVLINDYTHRQWRDLVTQELVLFINEGALTVIPVKIGNKPIGVICAQRFANVKEDDIKGRESKKADKKEISTDDFQQLSSLIEHLNMCLTMIMMR